MFGLGEKSVRIFLGRLDVGMRGSGRELVCVHEDIPFLLMYCFNF